jgi:N-acetylglucosaminyl-diphospho-decaprenol L-rhamnosyltransferase
MIQTMHPAIPHTPEPLLSVIVVNWNTRSLLGGCLDSIDSTIGDTPTEIWVVDNASSDGSLAFLRANYPHVNVIANETNVGFARANNQAAAQCHGKYLLLLNSDAVLLNAAAPGLIKILEAHLETAAVGPMLLNADKSFQAGGTDFPTLASEILLALGIARWWRQGYFPGYPPSHAGGVVDWVGGACLLIRRDAFEHIGALSEEYYMYTEETDWCYRARRAGWKIRYSPNQQVIHYGGASASQSPLAMRGQLYKSKLHFFKRHRNWLEYTLLRATFVLSAAAKGLVYSFAARLAQSQKIFYAHKAQSFWQVYRECSSMR